MPPVVMGLSFDVGKPVLAKDRLSTYTFLGNKFGSTFHRHLQVLAFQ
jgi:hypothetical protein